MLASKSQRRRLAKPALIACQIFPEYATGHVRANFSTITVRLEDAPRRKRAHVPPKITFKTKPQIALEQIRAALQANVAPGVVLMDAGYGNNGIVRRALTELELTYVAAITSTVKARHLRKNDPKPPRVSVEALALSLPKHAWRTVTWREGTNEKLQSRFARVRVRAAPLRGEARFGEETLLVEWPEGETKPTKYWFATLDRKMSYPRLVDLAKMRWRIEHDYEDLKQKPRLARLPPSRYAALRRRHGHLLRRCRSDPALQVLRLAIAQRWPGIQLPRPTRLYGCRHAQHRTAPTARQRRPRRNAHPDCTGESFPHPSQFQFSGRSNSLSH
jgi:hypothetical protein